MFLSSPPCRIHQLLGVLDHRALCIALNFINDCDQCFVVLGDGIDHTGGRMVHVDGQTGASGSVQTSNRCGHDISYVTR